jgi:hypothetical protein
MLSYVPASVILLHSLHIILCDKTNNAQLQSVIQSNEDISSLSSRISMYINDRCTEHNLVCSVS